MSGRAVRIAFTLPLLLLALGAPKEASAQMPDPASMSGIPMPSGELANGTVTVRVIRGNLGNDVVGQKVDLQASERTMSAETDAQGRATFSGLEAGATVKASATVDGESLVSQEFMVPPAGGVRVMLVARPASGGAAAGAAPVPAVEGQVSLGGQSRIVIEFGDDGLRVFYLFEIHNAGTVPVQTGGPIAFDLPADARAVSRLEGSSSQVTVAGSRVSVTGPFPPGTTPVEIGFTLPVSSSAFSVVQSFPIALQLLSVMAEKPGQMHLTSPQFNTHGDRVIDGKPFVVANGPGIPAGGVLTLQFENVPHASTWPRTLAVAIALAVLLWGAWAASDTGSAEVTAHQHKLEARRDRLFEQLVRLEEELATKGPDPQRAARRADLTAQLERLYRDLDRLDVTGHSGPASASAPRSAAMGQS